MTNTNVSPALAWASNAVELETSFLTTVVDALDQLSQGNRTDLSILLTVTHGIKTNLVPVIEGERMKFATPLKRILFACYPELGFKADKKKASGVVYTQTFGAELPDECGTPDSNMNWLRVMAEDGVTVKSDRFKAFMKDTTPEKIVVTKTAAQSREKASKDVVRLLKVADASKHDPLAYARAMSEYFSKIVTDLQPPMIAAE